MCFGCFLWVFWADVAPLAAFSSWSVSIVAFPFNFLSLNVLIPLSFPGDSMQKKRGCVGVNVVKGQFLSKTQKQLMLHLSAGQRAAPHWTGFRGFFSLSPLSWEHTALWPLSSDVVLDFGPAKRFSCVSFCFFFCLCYDAVWFPENWPNMVPMEKVLDAVVALKKRFCSVFQRQSSVIIPSLLSSLLNLAALSQCMKRAWFFRTLEDEQMPLN